MKIKCVIEKFPIGCEIRPTYLGTESSFIVINYEISGREGVRYPIILKVVRLMGEHVLVEDDETGIKTLEFYPKGNISYVNPDYFERVSCQS